MSDKILSIVIPVWNKSHFTKACLEDLSKLPDDHEIIIVNNGSTDNTHDLLMQLADLPELHNKLAYQNAGANLGFAKACNLGYAMSTAPNVLFLNNDVRVRADYEIWTENLIAYCDSSLVGPTMGQLDGQLNFVQEANKTLTGNSYMSGWCLASSREIWKKLEIPRNPLLIYDRIPAPQIFSEEFGLAYFEDTDLSFRAKLLGIPFKVVPIPVVHFGKQTSAQLNTHKLYSSAKQIFVNKWKK